MACKGSPLPFEGPVHAGIMLVSEDVDSARSETSYYAKMGGAGGVQVNSIICPSVSITLLDKLYISVPCSIRETHAC